MKAPALVLLLLGVTLSGCFGDIRGSDSADQNPPVPAKESLVFTDCREHIGSFPLVKSDAAPYLPEGFDPVSSDPGAATADAVLYAFACHVDWDGLALPIEEMWFSLMVSPPDEYQDEDIAFYIVPLRIITSDRDLRDSYVEWGLGLAEQGKIVITTPTQTALFRIGEAQATVGEESLWMGSTVRGERSEGAAGKERVFGVADGVVTGIVDVTWSAAETFRGEAVLGEAAPSPLVPRSAGVGLHVWYDRAEITPFEMPH